MPIARIDLFTTIHKGIRALLFDMATQAGRTGPADARAVADLIETLERGLSMLREHALHEDLNVLPLVSSHAPDLALSLAHDHAAIEGLQRGLDRLLARLAETRGEERAAQLQRVQSAVARIVAAQLEHMDREETEANPVLWARLDDAALGAARARIQGAIAPERFAEWMALVLPACNPQERAALEAARAARA